MAAVRALEPRTNDIAISAHYANRHLLQAIQAALAKLGKSVDTVTVEGLAPVDEFHIGGRRATRHLLDQLGFSERDHVLDVGCGLGGAARFVASTHGSRVTGIDVTPDYIESGNALCAWVNLQGQVTLQQGSALAMPFQDKTFDGGYMMHVGMNIANKARLFAEIYRVLQPGALFGVYDIMRSQDGELSYPVPWATEAPMSQLATLDQYRQAVTEAGFEMVKENNRCAFALTFFRELRAKMQGNPSPLGLHLLMGESTGVKIENIVAGLEADYIVPIELIAHKP